MKMIAREFHNARVQGSLDAITAPNHNKLHDCVLRGVCVLRACFRRLGVSIALVPVVYAVDLGCSQVKENLWSHIWQRGGVVSNVSGGHWFEQVWHTFLRSYDALRLL